MLATVVCTVLLTRKGARSLKAERHHLCEAPVTKFYIFLGKGQGNFYIYSWCVVDLAFAVDARNLVSQVRQ